MDTASYIDMQEFFFSISTSVGGMNGLWAIYIYIPGLSVTSTPSVRSRVRSEVGVSGLRSYTTYAHTNANLYDYMICHII